MAIGNVGAKQDLDIAQGSTFSVTVTLTDPGTLEPMDLTGCSVRGQIRRAALAADADAAFTCTIDAVPTTGVFVFGLSDSVTAALDAGEHPTDGSSKYVWDLELVDASARVTRLLYGSVTVHREVTRA